MMLLAIDPGAHGAMAVFRDGTPEVVDLPYLAGQIDPEALFASLLADAPLLLTMVLERQQYMPLPGAQRPGGKGAFQKGLNYGLLLGACKMMSELYSWPILQVSPQTWKKKMGLTSDKELSRRLAIELFPGLRDQLTRKKDEGRAEALLLGTYALRHLNV